MATDLVLEYLRSVSLYRLEERVEVGKNDL